MTLAFITAAMAAGVAAAGLTSLALWVVTILTRSDAAWGVAPWLIGAIAVGVAALSYLGEWIAYQRTMMRQRATGEPWAYRR